MCGLIGYLSKNNIDKDKFNFLSLKQIHRGPDEFNSIILNNLSYNIYFSHQRLSILDISSGKQPMSDNENNIIIIFNGEIYNHKELRTELENLGYVFKTEHSDTEAIIYAYKEWNTDCFEKFNGMWAVAIYDKISNKIVLSRDRVGKKPLYYYLDNNQLFFASELKTIKAYYKDKLTVCERSIHEYLEYGYIHSPNTIYKEVKKIKPSFYIEFDLNFKSISCKEYKYWNFIPNSNYENEANWNDKLEELLVDAVKLRLDADVAVGTFLSGGVDSALVSSIIAQIDNSITSYTIGFKDSLLDELEDAKFVAQKIGIKHKYEDMSKLDYQLWDEIIEKLDEPFADASIFPSYAVSKMASKDLKVVLSGDGGDEQFLGYPRYDIAQNNYDKYKVFSFLGSLFVKFFPYSTKGYKFATFLKNSKNLSNLYNALLKDPIISSITNKKYQLENPYKNCKDINDILFHDLTLNMSDQILTKVDRMSMLNSLEVRSPLLDYRVIEHVFSAPLNFRYKNSDKKYALKQLSIKLGIPKEYIYKNKRGFNAPINEWLKTILKNDLYKAADLKYIKKDKYLEALNLTLDGKRDYFVSLFRIVLLHKWLEKNG